MKKYLQLYRDLWAFWSNTFPVINFLKLARLSADSCEASNYFWNLRTTRFWCFCCCCCCCWCCWCCCCCCCCCCGSFLSRLLRWSEFVWLNRSFSDQYAKALVHKEKRTRQDYDELFCIVSSLPAFLRLVFQPLISVQTSFLIGVWQPSGFDYWSLLTAAHLTLEFYARWGVSQ